MDNNEKKFISALLSAKRSEQERFYTQQIPKGVFKICDSEVAWIYRFRERHGVYPSKGAFEANFNEKLKPNRETVMSSLQPVLDMAMFTQMRDANKKAKEMLDGGTDVSSVMAYFKEAAGKLSSYSTEYNDLDFNKSGHALKAYRRLVRTITLNPNSLLRTPWPTMNKLIGFHLPGEVITIAARTSLGKTWIVCNWADYYASLGIETLFITKEMTTESIGNRFEAHRFKLPWERFRKGELTPEELGRWVKQRRSCEQDNYPLYISGDETIEGVGLAHVIAKIKQYKPQIVFIDGAYLIQPEGVSKQAKQNERFAYLSNRMKAIAKATNTVIFLVIQMNRTAEKASGETKGSITSVYGSDTWAQDSDYVIDISGKRGSNARLISLLKGRESNIGEFNVKFQLSPYPFFGESRKGGAGFTFAPTGKIDFKGVA